MFKFLKGFLIGIANVIPGLCSATVSLMLRMYDELLDAISSVFKFRKWKQYAYLYVSIVLGIIFGIIVLNSLYNIIPFILNMIFLALLIKTFPVSISENKIKLNIVIFTLGLIVVVGLGFVNGNFILLDYNELNISTIFFIIINGLLSSLAMILPGISGALLLVVTGIYFPLLSNIEYVIKSIITFNITTIHPILFVGIFAISFIVGLIISSKLMKNLLNNHKSFTYSIINGMIIGSLINLVFNSYGLQKNIFDVVLGIILLIIVYFIPINKNNA